MKPSSLLIERAGLFDSRHRFPAQTVTAPRAVETYELEYFFEDGGTAVVNGQEYPLKKDHVLLVRPGDVRYSHLHFRCRFFHFTVKEACLAEAIAKIPRFFRVDAPQKAEEAFVAVAADFYSSDPFDRLCAEAGLVLLLRRRGFLAEAKEDPLTKAKNLMETHYREDLTTESVAAACHVSVSYLHRLFRLSSDTTPGDYLISCRLAAAKNLLLSTDLSLNEIADRCGFHSQSYFSDSFKKRVGTAPRDFRKKGAYLL